MVVRLHWGRKYAGGEKRVLEIPGDWAWENRFRHVNARIMSRMLAYP
jgi:hypothetical protein